MTEQVAFLDGRIVPANEVNVAWDAPGFRQGFGLFETIRIASHRAFLAGAHAQRITEAAPRLGIDPWLHPRSLAKGIDRLVARSGLADGAVRVFLMPGSPPPGEEAMEGGAQWGGEPERGTAEGCGDPREARAMDSVGYEAGGSGMGSLSQSFPAQRGGSTTGSAAEFHRPGRTAARYLGSLSTVRVVPPESVRAVLSPDLRDPNGPLVGLKTISYAGERLLLAMARRRGADEALRRNLAGRISEGTRSNIFAIEGERLLTPPLSEGLLPGVTRWFILRISRECGFVPAEEPLTVERLMAAEEAFLTSTLRGVVPLVAVDDKPIGAGAPGPKTVRLRAIVERLTTRGRDSL